MDPQQMRELLQVKYWLGDASVPDGCWRADDKDLIRLWAPHFQQMTPTHLEGLHALACHPDEFERHFLEGE